MSSPIIEIHGSSLKTYLKIQPMKLYFSCFFSARNIMVLFLFGTVLCSCYGNFITGSESVICHSERDFGTFTQLVFE